METHRLTKRHAALLLRPAAVESALTPPRTQRIVASAAKRARAGGFASTASASLVKLDLHYAMATASTPSRTARIAAPAVKSARAEGSASTVGANAQRILRSAVAFAPRWTGIGTTVALVAIGAQTVAAITAFVACPAGPTGVVRRTRCVFSESIAFSSWLPSPIYTRISPKLCLVEMLGLCVAAEVLNG